MRTLSRSIVVGGSLVLALSAACNLENALGVDGDGDGDGDSGMDEVGITDNDTAQADGSGTGTPAPTPTPADSTDTGSELPPTACAGRPLRVATYNVQYVGAEGSQEFQALADVVRRIDADVICLQEVQFWETQALFDLADATGYPRVIQADESPAIGGDHTNACLSRDLLTLEGSYTGSELSDDPGANDVGRDILVVRVNLSTDEASCGLGVVTLHLKSGQDPLDWFRRQVEVERVTEAVQRYRDAHPEEPVVILGDLNENDDDSALGHVFPGPPQGLPSSYDVGSDIEFPLTYEPFALLAEQGFTMADATQEDSNSNRTWNDVVRLDYVLYADADLVADEVYSSCRDNGVDDEPPGSWVPKAGEPLECGVSEQASDHFPVLADIVLP